MRRIPFYRTVTSIVYVLLLVVPMLSISPVHAGIEDLTLENIQWVSKRRINRFVWEYTATADAHNAGTENLFGVHATLTSNADGLTVVEEDLDFGVVAASGLAPSIDTFRFQLDRRFRFDAAGFQIAWQGDAETPTSEVVFNSDFGIVETPYSTLEIAPFAIDQNTLEISITDLADLDEGDERIPVVRLEPSGIEFSAPVWLTVDYNRIGIETPRDYRWIYGSGDEFSEAEILDVNSTAGTVSLAIRHFSEVAAEEITGHPYRSPYRGFAGSLREFSDSHCGHDHQVSQSTDFANHVYATQFGNLEG